jgi:hypothetical protein
MVDEVEQDECLRVHSVSLLVLIRWLLVVEDWVAEEVVVHINPVQTVEIQKYQH